jgi:Tol biopolymer transport system component
VVVFRKVRLLAALAGSLLLVAGCASGASARSGSARSVPRWASHVFIVFKYLDSLAQIRPGEESGGILVGGPPGHMLGPRTPWDPALSPNGRSLAFRGDYKPFNEGNFALYIDNLRTGKFRRVTQSVAGDPAWSSDGKWIAFDDGGGGEIWKVRASSGKPIRLTHRPTNAVGDAHPTWSPNGRQIAFAHWVKGRHGQIWVMRSDGRSALLLHADSKLSDEAPVWSQDGSRIAYVARHGSKGSIEVMKADGSDTHAVTKPSMVAWDPVWLPHDTGIAFLGGGSVYGGGNLFVMHADGRAVHQLTRWRGRARTPQFSWTSARMLVGRA